MGITPSRLAGIAAAALGIMVALSGCGSDTAPPKGATSATVAPGPSDSLGIQPYTGSGTPLSGKLAPLAAIPNRQDHLGLQAAIDGLNCAPNVAIQVEDKTHFVQPCVYGYATLEFKGGKRTASTSFKGSAMQLTGDIGCPTIESTFGGNGQEPVAYALRGRMGNGAWSNWDISNGHHDWCPSSADEVDQIIMIITKPGLTAYAPAGLKAPYGFVWTPPCTDELLALYV